MGGEPHLLVGCAKGQVADATAASTSLAGEVCLWDIRSRDPVEKLQAHQGEMFVCDMHDQAPVFAT